MDLNIGDYESPIFSLGNHREISGINVTKSSTGKLPKSKNGMQSFMKEDTGMPDTLAAVKRLVATGGVI